MDGTGINIMDRKLGHMIQLDANVGINISFIIAFFAGVGGGGGWVRGGLEVSIVQCNDAELWPSLSLTIR